jgi:PAS domain S-box-containing protein
MAERMDRQPKAQLPSSILLVDDDPDLRTVLSDALEHEGYRVEAVGQGAEALMRARQESFSAVILDIGLPDLDGQSVLHALLERDPTLPVIVLTGQTGDAQRIRSLNKGAFAFVTKPYKLDEIKATLKRAAGVQALAVKARRAESELSASEERFRSVVESASDAIILADGQGRILSCNQAARTLFGFPSEEMLGRPLTTLMPERYRSAHEEGLARLSRMGTSRVIGKILEVHGLKHDGTEFPVELTLGTWGGDGQVFYSGILRDISERKRAEQRLRAQYATTRILSEAETLKEATSGILQTICETLGWDLGLYWTIDPEVNALRHVESWGMLGSLVLAFTQSERSVTFTPGVGLPGRVWANKAPAWIPDLQQDDNFPRAPQAKKAGLCSGFGFPILLGGEVQGVLEFFSRRSQAPDQDLLALFGSIGGQIGQFTARKQSEADRERLIRELQDALANIKTLRGLLPICASCKKIRDEGGSWNQIEEYILARSEALFTHGICPDCARKQHPDWDEA